MTDSPANLGPRIVLRKGCDRRLVQGHDWVFSNEIDPQSGRDRIWQPGDLVSVVDYRGRFLATAYYNPHSLIAARVLSRAPLTVIDAEWMYERLRRALQLRQTMFSQSFYRWVNAEGDYLPGLVIDRFGEFLSIQISTAGMERLRPCLVEALRRFEFVAGAVLRFNETFAALEQWQQRAPETIGVVPPSVVVREGTLEFEADLVSGQKTGWYYDQTSNRQRMLKYLGGGSMLDLFCYAGAWGITAKAYGAQRVVCCDNSAAAIAAVERNSHRNHLTVETRTGDAFETLRDLQGGELFQTIVLDPPALIKRKKDFPAGLQAYYQLNRLAAKLLAPDGVLISCSCSHHLPTEQLIKIVHHAARSVGRRAVLTELGEQSPDHPRHPAIPETAYLKAVFCQLRNEV